MNKNFQKGFTLIEILIAVALFAIVGRIVWASFNSLNNRQVLDSEVFFIKSVIQKVRLESLDSKGGIAHGIIFGSSTLTVVDQGATTTRVYMYTNGVQLSTSTIGTSTIVFSKVSGLPSATGTLTYSLTKGGTVIGTSSFSVNGVGVIQ